MKQEEKTITKHFRLVEQSIGWLRAGANLSGFALSECKPLIDHLLKVFKTRGMASGIAYTKAVRSDVMNYLSGNPERSGSVRLATGGIPICLGPLKKYVREQNPEILRIVLTILFSTRALKLKASPNLEPILAPSKRESATHGITLWAGSFWKQLGYNHSGFLPNSLKFKRFHFSTKTGPNGHALNSWYRDLLQMPDRLIASVSIMGGEKLASFMSLAQRTTLLRTFFPVDGASIRKLSAFADKEGKTRVIAIGDYFSQTVLKRLHSYLFNALKKIPQDMTFDQGAFVNVVKDWKVFYSVDLTAATDRFPIDVITNVLAAHLPTEYVLAWKDIMIGYPFDFKKSDGEIQKVSYSVGNPMGFYSSWASFALAHHYIMYYISRRLGKDWTTLPYCLLGDDILIGDDEVGRLYLETMKLLGVDVSMAKTHISTTTLEFAKRWIHKGREISPFPVSALKECGKKYYFLTSLLVQQQERGWAIDVSEMVGDFFGRFLNRRRSFRKAMAQKSFVSEKIMKIMNGTLPASILFGVARRVGIPLPPLSEWSAETILADATLDLFTESDPTLKSKGKPLGLLAEELLLLITGALEETPEVWDLLENPLLHAYGSVEQTYLDLLKLSKNVSGSDMAGKWPVLLRNMTIPLSDKLFIDRAEQTQSVAVSRVATKVTEYLQHYANFPRDIPRNVKLGP
nr:MAG: putative RNA dependent RNA polymerase [Yunnan mito-like virus 29]